MRCLQRFWFGDGDLLEYFGRLSLRDANNLDAGLMRRATSRPTANRACNVGGATADFSPDYLHVDGCVR